MSDVIGWQPMNTAPTDGTVVLLLLECSNVPHSARFKDGAWRLTWDGWKVPEWDGPRYWMPIPPDPVTRQNGDGFKSVADALNKQS